MNCSNGPVSNADSRIDFAGASQAPMHVNATLQ